MARRPAIITQADVARAIRAAKQAGADCVEVVLPTAKIIVRLEPQKSTGGEPALEEAKEIVL